MTENKKWAYFYDRDAEMDEYWGKTLLGPDDFECLLGEPEDATWFRDGVPAMNRLNEQHVEILRLRNLLENLGVNPDAS